MSRCSGNHQPVARRSLRSLGSRSRRIWVKKGVGRPMRRCGFIEGWDHGKARLSRRERSTNFIAT